MTEEEYYEQLRDWGFRHSGERTDITQVWLYDGNEYLVPDPANLNPEQRGAVLCLIGMQAGTMPRDPGVH